MRQLIEQRLLEKTEKGVLKIKGTPKRVRMPVPFEDIKLIVVTSGPFEGDYPFTFKERPSKAGKMREFQSKHTDDEGMAQFIWLHSDGVLEFD